MSEKRKLSVVAIDTQILIWALPVAGDAKSKDDAEMRQRTSWLISELASETSPTSIVLPTVVVAEYLQEVDPADHSRSIELIRSFATIVDFNILAASIAASLRKKLLKERAAGAVGQRKVITNDVLIIATAAAHGARVFYSNDGDARKRAANVMEARDLPAGPSSLFP